MLFINQLYIKLEDVVNRKNRSVSPLAACQLAARRSQYWRAVEPWSVGLIKYKLALTAGISARISPHQSEVMSTVPLTRSDACTSRDVIKGNAR